LIGKTGTRRIEERYNNEEEERSRADERTHNSERPSKRGLEEIEALGKLIWLAGRNQKWWRKDATTRTRREQEQTSKHTTIRDRASEA
jgi:hypothetical protein